MKDAALLVAALVALCAATPAQAADNYVVVYEGAPAELSGKLEKLTALSLKRRPYPTAAAIRRAAASDVETVRKALVAAGYYAAVVDFRLSGESKGDVPVEAIFDIAPGAKFRIVEHVIVYSDLASEDRPKTFEEAQIALDASADGAHLEQNHQKLVGALWSMGFPAARMISRHAEADFKTGEAVAFYEVESGRRAVFDGVVIRGDLRTDDDFIHKLRTWTEGAPFDRSHLIDYRDALADTGLFASIEVEPGAVDDAGKAPVIVTLEERKRRTIGAGVSYSTSEGPGGRLFLEHRNVFRQGERARLEFAVAEIAQTASVDINKPLLAFDGLAFGNFVFKNETTDAFNARSFSAAGGFAKRFLDDRLELRGGVALETSNVRPKLATAPVAEERLYLVSTPLSAVWDSETSPLALEDGARLSLSVIPHAGTDSFTRFESHARSRRQFGASDRFTLAGRMRIAATAGSTLRALPVSKRVYAGGGSSVRGYGYQAVGPLDADNVPLGGRSAVEGAVELRARLTGKFEVAGFADAGAVYAEPFPDFLGDYLVGAGGGVRYLSAIGPVRLDVAVPLEKRDGDRDFQVYISLGQPF